MHHLSVLCSAVKPKTSKAPHLLVVSDVQLELHWDVPSGRVPAHCLEWEVERSREDDDGKVVSVMSSLQRNN